MLLNSEDTMQRFLKPFVIAFLASSLAATGAFAHAFLDHAIPSVGGTVSGPVRELRLWYTQGVVTAFSAVSVKNSAGASIPASKPVNDPSNQQEIIVRLGRALGPGSYTVTWRALSVDTHTTTGTFQFTVT
jgi:copper resistance protein C